MAYKSLSFNANGSVTSLDGLTGAINLTSTGHTISITTVGNDINLETVATGGVTSVNSLTGALTIVTGTSGTDFNINSTGTTITLELPTASALNRGALSSTDWSTFNGKQATGNYITALTGEVTASGPGSVSATVSNAAVIAKVLTGYVSGAGTVSATDSILSAIQKLNGNAAALVTGVSSVFGRTGAVVATSGDYTTAQVTESGNLYFTNARAIASTLTGYTSGAGTITSSDSILTAIQKLNGNIVANSYTFSTGLTNTTGTITANLSTGIAGGQTAVGGTASAENLILSSTTNATKGYIGVTNAATAVATRASFVVGSGGFAGAAGGFSGSASGTSFGINEPSSYVGNPIDIQIGGVTKLFQDYKGRLSINSTQTTGLSQVNLRSRANFNATGTCSTVGNAITGTGTLFLSELAVGDQVTINGTVRFLTSISSNTAATGSSSFGTSSGQTIAVAPGYMLITDNSGNPVVTIGGDKGIYFGSNFGGFILCGTNPSCSFVSGRIANVSIGSGGNSRMQGGNGSNGVINLQNANTESYFFAPISTNSSSVPQVLFDHPTPASGEPLMQWKRNSAIIATIDSVGKLFQGGTTVTPTAWIDLVGSSTTIASFRIRNGTAPTTPNDGEMWQDGTHLYGFLGGATRQLDRQAIAGSFSGVGTATTTFTVTIGATQANTTYKVNVTPTAVLSAAVFYVNNKTTTTFDVVYLAGLTGTVTFDWALFP